MTRRYVLSEQADADMLDIALYVALRSLDAADRLLESLHEKMALLAEHPGIGRNREELARELRSASAGRYIIFYRPTVDGILVVRVLHGARDISGEFEG